MKILVHGAINGSNFGDCIFAHLFYESMSRYGTTDFLHIPKYGMCKYLMIEIDGYKNTINNYKDADCLVYMSGGYFGDTTSSLKEAVKRYFRYFRVANYFLKNNKPIYICGIGGGPVNNLFLRKKIIRILNSAKFVSVRDKETADYFYRNGVHNRIIVTTDTALSIRDRKFPELNKNIKELTIGKKNIFLHVCGNNKSNKEIMEKILPSLNKYLTAHTNQYRVFVGTDNISRIKIKDLLVFKKLHGDKVAVDYSSTWELCSLLKHMDSIITIKLHVGIVSALYGKSVISFPIHVNKTLRFYKQIGYPERCKLLKDVDDNDVLSMLEKFMSENINIKSNLISKAYVNLKPF